VGGKLVGFNLDRKFSDVVDGLVIVDLRQTDPSGSGALYGQGRLRPFSPFPQARLVL
jgi:hypothetical protein